MLIAKLIEGGGGEGKDIKEEEEAPRRRRRRRRGKENCAWCLRTRQIKATRYSEIR